VRINLAYGREGLAVDLPEKSGHNPIDIIRPQFVPGLPDEPAAIRQALRAPIASPPLARLVKPGDSVVIVHTDITRATPNDRLLPVILAELEEAGIDRQEITLLNGLGTHRPQSDRELRLLLGDQIVENYRCLQHDCNDDDNLLPLGDTAQGHPVRINRTYLEADVKILTGFIEPHFFAGFSGGPKAILPSLAGAESVFTNHGLKMIAHPKSAWAITEGNPIWEEMRDVALRTRPTFLLNVALNAHRQITGLFAGDMLAAHAEGCRFVKEKAMAGVAQEYDIVLTTNSGYPLDQNLYQAVKGMSAASQVVRQGGAIVIAADCEDGLPDHGRYAELLALGGSPQGILELISQPGFSEQDQWQVQIQAQIQLKATVHVYSENLTPDQIIKALFVPSYSIEQTVMELIELAGPDCRLCIIPEGPQTIPYLSPGSP
jgi:nickel-dependent lactate racemase